MKTSNKLLLGLFLIILLGMIIVNFFLKNEMSKPAVNQIEIVQPADTDLLEADSLAMDEAILNE